MLPRYQRRAHLRETVAGLIFCKMTPSALCAIAVADEKQCASMRFGSWLCPAWCDDLLCAPPGEKSAVAATPSVHGSFTDREALKISVGQRNRRSSMSLYVVTGSGSEHPRGSWPNARIDNRPGSVLGQKVMARLKTTLSPSQRDCLCTLSRPRSVIRISLILFASD
jgi:hypothetical protein